MSCPLSSPKRTFLSVAKILCFRHLGATNYGFRTLSCTVTAYDSGARSRIFERQRRSPRKILLPTGRIVYRMCVRNASIPLQTPEPHRKDPSFYPFHLSTQLLDHLHPLTSPSRQPFSPSAHLPPHHFPPILLSLLPAPPHLATITPPPTKPAHSRTGTPTPHKRIGYKFPHPSMTDIPTHTHQHGIQTTKQQPDISRLDSFFFFFPVRSLSKY